MVTYYLKAPGLFKKFGGHQSFCEPLVVLVSDRTLRTDQIFISFLGVAETSADFTS